MKNAKNRRKQEKSKSSSLDTEWRKGLSKNVKRFYKERRRPVKAE